MPRKSRYSRPGSIYHLISRFVDRNWFIEDEEDRSYYLVLLGRALATTDWLSLGYAVMSNHFHLAFVAGQQRLDTWIRRVHSPFADWLNKKYERIGSIFVRGPKQLEVRPDRVGKLLAYIHNNPVRAGVVTDASASTWTSHRAYCGLVKPPAWLRVEEGLARARFGDRDAFNAFVQSQPNDRDSHRRREQELLRDPEAFESFHVPPTSPRIGPDEVVVATARVLRMVPEAIRSRRRSASHVFARHVAAHCADRLGISGAAIAAAASVTQQAVSLMLKSTDSQVLNAAASLAAELRRAL